MMYIYYSDWLYTKRERTMRDIARLSYFLYRLILMLSMNHSEAIYLFTKPFDCFLKFNLIFIQLNFKV